MVHEQFINDIKAKDATPVMCSLIPRNSWKDGKVNHNNVDSYAQWAEEVTKNSNIYFIDLNKMVANNYDQEGQEKVKTYFGTKDNVHS